MAARVSRPQAGHLRRTCGLLCLLLAPLAGACASPTPTPTLAPVTMTFLYPRGMGGDVESWYREQAREFNESNPGIKVELTSARTGEEDASTEGAWPEEFRHLMAESLLALDPLIDADATFSISDFYASVLALYTDEAGEVYAVPASVNPQVICYNRDLFDLYSVPYPEAGWTWEEFLDTALALRDPQAQVFGYGGLRPHDSHPYDSLPRARWNASGDSVAVLRWYADLVHGLDVAPTAEQASEAFGNLSGVHLGQVGMWVDDFHSCGSAPGEHVWEREQLDFRFGFAPLPQPSCPLSVSGVFAYAISSQTAHPEACWRWISYLSEQVHPWLIPARRSLAESAAYEQMVGPEVAALALSTLEDVSALMPADHLVSEYEEIRELYLFGDAVTAIIEGCETAEDALAIAEQELDEEELPVGGYIVR